jgi:hypothetical protein
MARAAEAGTMSPILDFMSTKMFFIKNITGIDAAQ